jgi:hypothetical protein
MGKMIIQFLFNHLKKKYNDEIGDYNHHFIFYFMPVHQNKGYRIRNHHFN